MRNPNNAFVRGSNVRRSFDRFEAESNDDDYSDEESDNEPFEGRKVVASLAEESAGFFSYDLDLRWQNLKKQKSGPMLG